MTKVKVTRLSRVNTNLLVSLQVLLQECNVTRASERLSLTPSAVSKNLARLREMFDDELLTLHKGKLIPTPKAEMLQESLRMALKAIEDVVYPEPEDPGQFEGTIRLAVPEPASTFLVPTLIDKIKNTASHVILQTHNVLEDYQERLKVGTLDFCIYPESHAPGLRSELIGSVRLVCAMRKDHPLAAANELDIEKFTAAKKIFYFSPDVDKHWLIGYNERLRRSNQEILTLESNQLFTAINLLLTTDAILFTIAGLQNCPLCRGLICEKSLPQSELMPSTNMNLYFITHSRIQSSPLHQWAAKLICETTETLMPISTSYCGDQP